MESASVNAELPDAFPPAPPLAGEGAPVLLVAVLAAMGATLAVVSASIWLAPPVTPPESVPPQSYEYIQPEEQHYWYFCPDPEGYYPYVNKCPKGWQKVVPAPPDDEEE